MDNEISILREQLCKMIETEEVDSPEVVALSQKLDIFILKYYECYKQNNKTAALAY